MSKSVSKKRKLSETKEDPPLRKTARKIIKDETISSKEKSKVTKTKVLNKVSHSKEPKKASTSSEQILRSNVNFKSWTVAELLSEQTDVDYSIINNIVKLFEEENTIPFICRYRKEMIGDINSERMRDIKMSYNSILNLQMKAETMTKTLMKNNLLTEEINQSLTCAKTLEELEHLYAPYKPASKSSLAERARLLGLENPAKNILFGQIPQIDLNKLINEKDEELNTKLKVENGIKNIISNIFCKDTSVLEEIRRLQKCNHLTIQVTQRKSSKESKTSQELSKFELYFNFNINVKNIKPHQILAINRGENLKILSVKIVIPESFKNSLNRFLQNNYMTTGVFSKLRSDIYNATFDESYSKKFSPLVSRQIRSDLTKIAENSSIEVFATNLKQLLLMSPVGGKKILGIDPGFTNGCKIALISECTEVLETCVIYPNSKTKFWREYGISIAELMNKHKCNLIALGNGVACRETETWIAQLLDENILNNDVRYCIVSEQGVSIYSCSEIAQKEFPKLEVNLISAVSIARRLSDPLCELVKVEPKHLGVGMYQHDINEKSLSDTLNEVVIECVSFTGVDINTASVSLLSHVAGLTIKKAENIINYRIKNGAIKSREELQKVKSIGEKTFTQCAGFLRIEPRSAGTMKYNILDSTWVHPESYDLAKRIISDCNLSTKDIGTPDFIRVIKSHSSDSSILKIAQKTNHSKEKIKCVMDALQRELFQDYRIDFDKKPMFKKGITKMSDLKVGTNVTGAITNITHFGCFVDIGVEKNGLIHCSQLNGRNPSIGDLINASVISIDTGKGRIGLKLNSIL